MMEVRLAKGRKRGAQSPQDDSGGAFTGREADLHRQIEDNVKTRRWLMIHSRTDKATTTAKGIPDFVLFPGGGKVVFIEVKVGKNKLSPEQRAWEYCAEVLGYRFFVVRSFAEFIEAIENL